MRRSAAAVVAAFVIGTALGGCGSSDVTEDEIAAFTEQVQADVEHMQQYQDKDDLANLVTSICDSFAGGQSYGNVSETVGAYIRLDASTEEVDDVIAVALDTACPELKDEAGF